MLSFDPFKIMSEAEARAPKSKQTSLSAPSRIGFYSYRPCGMVRGVRGFVVWSCVVRSGVVWCGVVWCGLVGCGVVGVLRKQYILFLGKLIRQHPGTSHA